LRPLDGQALKLRVSDSIATFQNRRVSESLRFACLESLTPHAEIRSPIKERMDLIKEELANEQDRQPTAVTHKPDIVDMDQVQGDGDHDVAPQDASLEREEINDNLKEWVTFADNLFVRHCKLVVDPGSASGIAEAFQGTGVSNVAVEDGKRHILVIFDAKAMGEASARAHLRTCPMREECVNRAVKGILQATTDGLSIPSGYIFAMFDGFLHGNEGRLLKPFTTPDGSILKKDKKQLFLTFSEDSMKESKGRLAGTGTMHLVEFVYLVTAQALATVENLACPKRSVAMCCDHVSKTYASKVCARVSNAWVAKQAKRGCNPWCPVPCLPNHVLHVFKAHRPCVEDMWLCFEHVEAMCPNRWAGALAKLWSLPWFETVTSPRAQHVTSMVWKYGCHVSET